MKYRFIFGIAFALTIWISNSSLASASCVGNDCSVFVSQSVPSAMEFGTTYQVSVTMRNEGSTTWTAGNSYRLGSQNPQDNSNWGLSRVALPSSVSPGQSVTFTFNVTAPTWTGLYNFQWQMVRDGVTWFGDSSNTVRIGINMVAGDWKYKSPMPTARSYHSMAVANNKVYAIGGSGGGVTLNTNEEYDPATDAWTTKQNMPTARLALGIASVNGKIYAIGGYNGSNNLNTNEEYDPATNTWSTKQSMPTIRQTELAVVGGKIYAIGGYNGVQVLAVNEEYDPSTNSWAAKRSIPTARVEHGLGVANNKIYAFGGRGSSWGELSSNEEYDPAGDSWAAKRSMLLSTHNHASVSANNRLYSFGGWNNSNRTQEYDSASDRWTLKADMPDNRWEASAASIGNKIYVTGGSWTNTNFEYIPNPGDSWISKSPLPNPRFYLAAAAVNNKIYAIGGSQGQHNEEYDPATNSWTTKANLLTPRFGLAAAAANGKIYVLGGDSGSGIVYNLNQEYDPITNTWTNKAPMPTHRWALSAAAANGKIYAFGGFENNKTEEYNPATNSWVSKADMAFGGSYGSSAATVDGKIYVMVGFSNSEYNPSTNTWLAKANRPGDGAIYTAAVALNGKIYVLGGFTIQVNPIVSQQTSEYDPITNKWAHRASMQSARYGLAAAVVGNRIYAFGGNTSGGGFDAPTGANEEYMPAGPSIVSLTPISKVVGDGSFTLTVDGSNFSSGAVVRFNGSDRTTTFVSSSKLTATILSSDLANAGIFEVTVFDPVLNIISYPLTFTINNPFPTTTSLSPATMIVGTTGAQTLTVNGTNFNSQSVVNYDGSARSTTLISSTQVSIQLSTSDLSTTGTHTVSVTNPTPGGGTSTPNLTFTVVNPLPTATSLSPSSVTAGSSAQTLTVTGTGFRNGVSSVNYDGSSRTTTFNSSTSLSISLSASDLVNAGTHTVSVTNPTPGGGTSTPNLTFTINNPAPTVSSISPTSKLTTDSDFTLTVNGTNFNSQSVIRWGNTNKATTLVSSTQLTTTVTAAEISVAGTRSITVFAPTPGGGTSSSQTFTINNPFPTTTTLNPSSMMVGTAGPQTLEINGTNFNTQSVVSYDGSSRTTTLVDSTKVRITLSTSDLSVTGTHTVSVTNPAPGGGVSSPNLTFSVSNPLPSTSSITPSEKMVGDSAFTLTVYGSNFNINSVVRYNSADRATTYISPTELRASISATDLQTATTVQIKVFAPTPGGGLSGAQTFTVLNYVPATTSISPTSKPVADADFTLTVNGTNFVPSSVVRFDGINKSTTYVSPTRLTAIIPRTDLLVPDIYPITVFSPTPGGGESNAQNFTVEVFSSAPFTLSLDPSAATVSKAQYVGAGSPLTAVIEGSSSLTSGVAITGSPVIVLYKDPVISRADGQSVGGPTKILARVNPGGCLQEAQIISDPKTQGCLSVFLVNPDASASGVTYYIDVTALNEAQREATARFTLTVKP